MELVSSAPTRLLLTNTRGSGNVCFINEFNVGVWFLIPTALQKEQIKREFPGVDVIAVKRDSITTKDKTQPIYFKKSIEVQQYGQQRLITL